MKYRIIGLTALVFTAALGLAANMYMTAAEENSRVHQHLSTPEKPACTQDHTDGTFCTHLPLITIHTGGKEIPGTLTDGRDMFGEHVYTTAPDGDSMTTVSMEVFDSKEAYNHPTDVPALSTAAEIRVRGHSSRQFEKAPYLIKLVNGDGTERDEPLLGMSEHNEWALHGPYLDKSLIRNYLFYNLSGEMMEYAPNCRFCELMLDGDYRGIYLLTETITAAEDGRLPIIMKEKDTMFSGYLLRIDRPTAGDLETLRDVDVFTERMNTQRVDVSLRYPGKGRLTEEIKERIERDFSAFEKALYSYDFDSGNHRYETYIDVDSFVDYYLINSVTSNADAGRYSTYIYKSVGGKYKMCVWDFNNCCDNLIADPTFEDFDGVRGAVYFNMLFRDKAFVERVICRYRELREGILSEEYLKNYMDGTLAFLGPAIERDSRRWAEYIASDTLYDPHGTGRNSHSQAEAVEQLKNNLFSRLQWLDGNIDYLRQLCAASANKKYNEIPT